jgi:hypothetical protein
MHTITHSAAPAQKSAAISTKSPSNFDQRQKKVLDLLISWLLIDGILPKIPAIWFRCTFKTASIYLPTLQKLSVISLPAPLKIPVIFLPALLLDAFHHNLRQFYVMPLFSNSCNIQKCQKNK